jgi:hypothetical protein
MFKSRGIHTFTATGKLGDDLVRFTDGEPIRMCLTPRRMEWAVDIEACKCILLIHRTTPKSGTLRLEVIPHAGKAYRYPGNDPDGFSPDDDKRITQGYRVEIVGTDFVGRISGTECCVFWPFEFDNGVYSFRFLPPEKEENLIKN